MNIPADEHCVRAAGPLVETAGPDAADPPERLLRELARVADLLRSSSRLDAEAMTAVVRLVPGLDLPRWQSISGQCDGWFALPLRDKERPVGNSPTADKRDAITGMWRAAAFTERLNAEVERARNARRALALILFEQSDLETLDRRSAACALRALSSRLWEASAEPDLLGRLQPGVLALALPGGGRFQALAVAERVVQATERDLAAQGLRCRLRAGVASLDEACGQSENDEASDRPNHADADLLERAGRALGQAARMPGASLRERVRMFRVDETPRERETLVLASEKHFLFFGGTQ